MLTYSIVSLRSGLDATETVSPNWTDKADAIMEAHEMMDSGAYVYAYVVEVPSAS